MPPPRLDITRKQVREQRLYWQSRVVLMLVLPVAVLYFVLGSVAQYASSPATHPALLSALSISTLFAFLVWRLRAATPFAAMSGGVLTACIYFGTIRPLPASPTTFEALTSWVHSGISPLLTLFALTYIATRYRRAAKERQGTAEPKHGRNAAQVCANLGIAALIQSPLIFTPHTFMVRAGSLWLAPILAALAEATADTVSSEVGQAAGGTPRLLTNLKPVSAGTDGAISLAGTTSGCLAAAAILWVAMAAMQVDSRTAAIALAAGIFGLFFDSLLGATLERGGYLNNDTVNFISTLAAAVAAGFVVASGRWS